ncbi:MAG: hydrogenase 4 subunit B [Coriobacteriales bacterium]|jgi:hydrogenase-4 component B|nr:hydrogenase 4 subunit B [Coriobacteriales bacterium]
MDILSLDAPSVFSFSAALSVVGALVALLTGRSEGLSKGLASIFGVLASLAMLGVGAGSLLGSAAAVSIPTPFAFASFSLLFSPLAGLLLVVINLLAVLAWIYGASYLAEYRGKGIGAIGFFMNLFVVSMNFVVTVDNAFWFLVFFELMSLSSYFLVIIEQDEKSTNGGFLYLIMAHVGFLMIMVAFFVMAGVTGSFEFAVFRGTQFAPAVASLVFVLTFLGFGCKAGMVPFHSWLPQAHPAAPSHVSALMSGGMIKIGVFGIVKVGLDILAASGCELWWGILVLSIGAVSSVLGVAYALAEHDIKRLLAYHSVENIGIILLGVGIGFIGIALEQPLLAALGLMAGLYHLLNHAVFKALLFLGAGSVLFSTHTRDMEKMGGLVRAMPVTAMCFLLGSLAISAIPPLNGFVSEWFTYQALFDVAFRGDAVIQLFAGFGAVSLAITGALAVTCFVKAYGVTFLGASRSEAAGKAREVPVPMRLSMVVLAAVCVFLGVGAPLVAPVMQAAASATLAAGPVAVAQGTLIANPEMGNIISTPLLAVLLVGLILIPLLVRMVFARGGVDATKEPWACGYRHEPGMPMIATSFGADVQMFMRPLYRLRAAVSRKAGRLVDLLEGAIKGAQGADAQAAEAQGDRYLADSTGAFVDWLGHLAKRIEGGNYRVYLVYIVVALLVFLSMSVLAY